MKTVKYETKFLPKAGRLELFIRWLWLIPTAIVACILEIIAMIAAVLQWFHILVLGKRHKFLHTWILKLIAYDVKFKSYFLLLTDERNPLLPEK